MHVTRLAMAAIVCLTLIVASLADAQAQGTPSAPTADAVCATYTATPAAADSATAANVDLANLDFDLLFLEAMIPHHQSAIDLATIVLERSDRQELKDFALTVIETRTVETAVMSGWRTEWYSDIPHLSEMQLIDAMNTQLAESPGVGGVAGLEEMGADHIAEDIRELCAEELDLDRMYIDMMLEHNSSSMVLSTEAINRAIHREIKNLGESMAVQLQLEIDQLLTWREIWFAGTPIPDHHDG